MSRSDYTPEKMAELIAEARRYDRAKRAAVLREVRKAVEAVKTSRDRDSYSYHSDPRSADEVKRDVLAILTRMED